MDLDGWALFWNPENGGRLNAVGRLPVPGAAAAFIRRFVDEHAALLGAGSDDLSANGTRSIGRIHHLFYSQTYDALPVEGARLSFSIGAGGNLLHFSARTAVDLCLPTTLPSISLAQARQRAFGGIAAPRGVRWDEEKLVVLPSCFSGLEGDRLAWRMRCRTSGPAGGWRLLVDARTGEVLERRSLVISTMTPARDPAPGNSGPAVWWSRQRGLPGLDRSAQGIEGIEGIVEGLIHFPSPWGQEYPVAFPDMAVSALDQDLLIAEGFTDSLGRFDLGELEASELVLEVALEGLYARIHEETRSSPPPRIRLENPSVPATIAWDSVSASAAAREAYIHMNTAHTRLKQIDPAFEWLDQPVPATVSDPSGTCNAGAYIIPENPSLRFLAGSDACANAARVADVVYHEYGHLATMYAYLPEQPPYELHEAFSDYFAATIRDTNLIGADFFGPGTFVRNLENDLTWPVDEQCASDPHCLGLLLGGALWEMRSALIDQIPEKAEAVTLADSLFHYARYGRPMDFGSCLVQMLLLDDDDEDLSNGTPHLDAIAAGFDRHGIGDFTVSITHLPLADTEDTTSAREVAASVGSIYPPDPQWVQICYSVNGGNCVVETMPGEARDFRGQIPPQKAGSMVRYYISAADVKGHESTLPEGAPAETFSYAVGTDETPPVVLHTPSGNPTTGQERLWLSAEITDNIGVIDTARITATVTRPETTQTMTLALVLKDPDLLPDLYETCLSLDALEESTEITYRLSAVDASSGQNQTWFPQEGEIELEVHKGRFWDFEFSSPDVTLAGDWERGGPEEGPDYAPSGQNLVGTRLDGHYSAMTVSHLTTGEIDLSAWKAARLEFATWYQAEEFHDGGRILASRDGGETWEVVTPADGYPAWIYCDEGALNPGQTSKAFSGASGGWLKVDAALDQFLGDPVQLRFEFVSDTLATDLGWFLDDIKIIEEQILVAPAQLKASVGDNGRVALSWSAPSGIDTSALSFLGYQIYRGTQPGEYAPEAINPAPHPYRWWFDRDISNGTRYYYAVTSLFATGESPPSAEAEGYPYLPILGTGTETEVWLEGTLTGADTLSIANAGTGDLKLDLYHADAEDQWSDVLPQHSFDGANDGAFTVLAEDGADAPAPDLRRLACQELNGYLYLRISLHDSLPDPRQDFTLWVYLDTDLSRSTGFPEVNTGAEYRVVMGREIYQSTQALASILNEDGEAIEAPSALILREGLDSVEVAVRLETIGSPNAVGITVQVVPEQGGLGGDRLPDEPLSSWLSFSQVTAIVTPETPLNLPLDFDFSGLVEDDYAATIFISSNDPDRPLAALPIAVHLSNLPVEGLSLWTSTPTADGLLLEWSPVEPDSFEGFLLRRWEGSASDEPSAISLGGGPISASGDAGYRFLDRSVESGRRYYYRLAGLTADSDTVLFSPPAHPLYDPPVVPRLVLEAPRPNPLRSITTLRIQAPPNVAWDLFVVDVTGRLVRRLVPRGGGLSGIHVVQWDGCRDNGTRADQGVYYAVARGGGQHLSRCLLLIR